MNRLNSVVEFFKLSAEDKKIFQNEMSTENARRAIILSLIVLPVSLLHVIVFFFKLDAVGVIEYKWVHSIIASHCLIILFTILCGLPLANFYFRKKKNRIVFSITTHTILLFLLIIGAVIASVDQFVTSAITPFFLTTMIAGLIFLIRPIFSLFYFTISCLIFCISIAYTQPNPDILISNQVNGIFVSTLGMCLSFILWRSNLTRIKQSQQISRHNKALSESNAEKDKFFTIIAHDLRSPFNSVLGFSDLLVHQVHEQNYEGIDKYAEYIQQSSRSAMELLSNLMEWSKAHTGRLDFKPELFEIRTLINEIEILFNGTMIQKNIRFEKEMPSDTVIYADMNMIRTLLRNLVSNAIKFSHMDGIVTLSIEKGLDYFTVSVSDNGIGIPQNAMEKLFRLDENVSTLGTQKEKGTGLGLILCKELVEKHAGKIWCESEFGKGSTFYVTLACCKDRSLS
jgi:signal transduction histidine kinase